MEVGIVTDLEARILFIGLPSVHATDEQRQAYEQLLTRLQMKRRKESY